MVETILSRVWLLGNVLLLLAVGNGRGLLGKALLLLSLCLGTVLVQDLEGLSSEVAVGDVLELGDGRRNLQAHVEDLLLALKPNVGGPSNHAAHVALRLDILTWTKSVVGCHSYTWALTDAIVAGTLLDERVFGRFFGGRRRLGLRESRGLCRC